MIPSENDAASRYRDENALLKAQLEYERELHEIDNEWNEIQQAYRYKFATAFGLNLRSDIPIWISAIASLLFLIGSGVFISAFLQIDFIDSIPFLLLMTVFVIFTVRGHFAAYRYRALQNYYRELRCNLCIDDFLPKKNQAVHSLD